MLKCDRVYEKSKHRLRLRDVGYSGLSLLFSDVQLTSTLIKCLLHQVLNTGEPDQLFNPLVTLLITLFITSSILTPVLMI